MKTTRHALPMQKTSGGEVIDTRPPDIEDWLNSLPYVDFERTSALLEEATAATNKVDIKPAIRLELVALYNRPYQYYVDTQIKLGSRHTLQSIELMVRQIAVLSRIAANLANACKLIAGEGVGHKTLWGRFKPYQVGMLQAIHYLSHELIFSYLQYTPAPDKFWREISKLYQQAEFAGLASAELKLPEGFGGGGNRTIAEAYKRMAVIALLDPYHLPFGAIWEIYNQLERWSSLSSLEIFKRGCERHGAFAVDLDNAARPAPLEEFDDRNLRETHRIIVVRDLEEEINARLDSMNRNGRTDPDLCISPHIARQVLMQMGKDLGTPPRRSSPRTASQGNVQLVFGINAIYFHGNGEKDFAAATAEESEQVVTDNPNNEPQAGALPAQYKAEHWNLMDMGPEGFSVSATAVQGNPIRVGDLVAIRREYIGRAGSSNWSLGDIRWMMKGSVGSNQYRLGIQIIAAEIMPAGLRALTGGTHEIEYRRAIVAGDGLERGMNNIVCAPGIYQTNRELELSVNGQTLPAIAADLVEASNNFEHLIIKV
ncbi:MAG TPA: hypothetical protein VJN91_01655 [Gammaproteobacteria bacterium]|nr:hypothetical protein [Gammaproteobacteria bacterium]